MLQAVYMATRQDFFKGVENVMIIITNSSDYKHIIHILFNLAYMPAYP